MGVLRSQPLRKALADYTSREGGRPVRLKRGYIALASRYFLNQLNSSLFHSSSARRFNSLASCSIALGAFASIC